MVPLPTLLPDSFAPRWRVAQLAGLGGTAVLLVGLIVKPGWSLGVLWNVLIPILPATFLISPALWRGVCPLATLNTLGNGLISRRRMPVQWLTRVGVVGLVLLAVLVPARRFLFNEHGTALVALILIVALAALLLGAVFDAKAGFCNAICPILPVEKLYGQHPLLDVPNPRCVPCRLCTAKGCLDLVPTKSIRRAIGNNAKHWLRSGYGIFAAAFPGFIVGYFATSNAALGEAWRVYAEVLAWAGGSYLVTGLLVFGLRLRAETMLPVLAAAAAALYYWFAAPSIMQTLGGGELGILLVRGAALGLVAGWLWRALGRGPAWPRSTGRRPAAVPVRSERITAES